MGIIAMIPGRDPGYWKASPQGWKNVIATYPGGTGLLEGQPSRLEECYRHLSGRDRATGRLALKAGRMLSPLIREGPGYWKASPQGWKNSIATYPGWIGVPGSSALSQKSDQRTNDENVSVALGQNTCTNI